MDQIQNRQQLALQYFEIRIALNKANGLRNDKTHLEFELRSTDDEDFVIIKSSGAHNGLRIASKFKNRLWEVNLNSKFIELFIYFVDRIKNLRPNENINEELTIWLFRLWIV